MNGAADGELGPGVELPGRRAARSRGPEPGGGDAGPRDGSRDGASERRVPDGFGADAPGEDRFDSVIGLLGLIGVLEGIRPDYVPEDPWIRRWEGWVLGQTALPRPAATP